MTPTPQGHFSAIRRKGRDGVLAGMSSPRCPVAINIRYRFMYLIFAYPAAVSRPTLSSFRRGAELILLLARALFLIMEIAFLSSPIDNRKSNLDLDLDTCLATLVLGVHLLLELRFQ